MRDPTETSVLFAPPVDDDGRLLRFCRSVKARFEEAGLIPPEDPRRGMLLHATVVNTVYVPQPRQQHQQQHSHHQQRRGRGRGRGRGGHGGRGNRERMTLDAREVLERFGDKVWVEGFAVRGVALCKMGARRVEGTDDERYEVVGEVRFGR